MPIATSPYTKRLTVLVEPDTFKKIGRLAASQDRSIAQFVRHAINSALVFQALNGPDRDADVQKARP